MNPLFFIAIFSKKLVKSVDGSAYGKSLEQQLFMSNSKRKGVDLWRDPEREV